MTTQVLLLVLLITCVTCDILLHVPRGSNNRLNEKTSNRKNPNRLFDSQNNNRGGYNVGDKSDKPSGDDEENQYRMTYFQSSSNHKLWFNEEGKTLLTIEWTMQHGCGGNEDTDPHKQNCVLVLQYMCQDNDKTATGGEENKHFTLRNGVQTNVQNYKGPHVLSESESAMKKRADSSVSRSCGLHEPWSWYDKCYIRERNKGLFTADQNLKINKELGYSSAIYTRQNPNGNRYGYECPEERDYYPYWHPTPWKDMVIFAENSSMCQYYVSRSFNVKSYHECVETFPGSTTRKHFSRWNNKADCIQNGGRWQELTNYLEKASEYKTKAACDQANQRTQAFGYKWAVPWDTVTGSAECLVTVEAPDCKQSPWTRSNHLGNGRDGLANMYTWTVPYFPSQRTKRCVIRIRYNVSSDDYDPYHTDASQNTDKRHGVMSPIQQNPYVDIGAGVSPLRLAINTAELGHVFQDRSHVFRLLPRPAGIQDQRIYNLNVRGRRGNIVQVYPAVEYDFAPNVLNMKSDDLVHIQWTGSNTHDNASPSGDGQAGDDGQGTSGTDRSNIAEVVDMNTNFPLPFESTTMWKNATVIWSYHGRKMSAEDLALNLASSGYYECTRGCNESPEKKQKLSNLLNNAPASYRGVLLQFKKGTYYFMCTRNNNFTNRSQKAKLVVD